jgi:hypothetical protein
MNRGVGGVPPPLFYPLRKAGGAQWTGGLGGSPPCCLSLKKEAGVRQLTGGLGGYPPCCLYSLPNFRFKHNYFTTMVGV